jgi:hypothetical protein
MILPLLRRSFPSFTGSGQVGDRPPPHISIMNQLCNSLRNGTDQVSLTLGDR